MGIVADTFTRADSAFLGSDWTEEVGDWGIASNQAENNDDDGSTGYYARFDGTGADVGSSDMFAELTIGSTQTNSGSNTGPSVRRRSGAVTGYQFPCNLGSDTVTMWRVVAGSETQLTLSTGGTSLSTPVATADLLRLEVIGAVLRGKVNGALVALAQDTNITDGQRGGMNGYNATGTDVVRADNFRAGRLVDDPPAAPFLLNWGIFSEGTITPRTPNLPTNPSVAAGDLILVPCVVRDAAQTVTPDATEGWVEIATASQTGLKMTLFGKVWGLGGQTDDSSPEFSVASATAGFGLVPIVVRNPQHATAPWTSVAAAVVASGQQSNASGTMVTAPSVNHSGDHRTVMRLFASADDNALGAPSVGALIFGGAAYDTTSGNDWAQAGSIAEDITVTTNTGTATVTETTQGPDISCGMTLVIAIPGGAAVTGTALVAGGGAIAGAGVREVPGSSTVAGGGVVSGAGTVGHTGSAAVAGGGAVSASAARGVTGAGLVAGGGSVAATGVVGRTGAAVVAGAGTITASGGSGKTGAAVVDGGGAVSASGVRHGTGQAAVTGSGMIAAAGARGVIGLSVMAGGGVIAASGQRAVAGAGTVAGGGVIAGLGIGVSSDVASQGTYDAWSGTPTYDGYGNQVYDGPSSHVYDP